MWSAIGVLIPACACCGHTATLAQIYLPTKLFPMYVVFGRTGHRSKNAKHLGFPSNKRVCIGGIYEKFMDQDWTAPSPSPSPKSPPTTTLCWTAAARCSSKPRRSSSCPRAAAKTITWGCSGCSIRRWRVIGSSRCARKKEHIWQVSVRGKSVTRLTRPTSLNVLSAPTALWPSPASSTPWPSNWPACNLLPCLLLI